ncbi:DMT family transporter [Actinomadura terrae]|uniref:DMT family transporter n=1 Tax=Actinomadura terrae TaxID=604353 RepID=UPI001FA7C307|nr:DMT family transporter [Actinomadura terrae]
MTGLGALIAIASGGCFALSAALQHRAAHREVRRDAAAPRTLDPRLLTRLVRRPLWLGGRLAAVLGVVLQALALRAAPLSLVQPLLMIGLALCVVLEPRLGGDRADRHTLGAALLATAGLTVFMIAAEPESGDGAPTATTMSVVVGACVLAILGCLAAARHKRVAGTALGAATGISFGLTAAMLKAGAGSFGDPVALVAGWTLYAYLACAAVALLLNQNAFLTGSLTAPLTAITLSEPITALLIGLTAFHEHIDLTGPRAALMLAGAVAMASGVRRLAAARPTPPPPDTVTPDRIKIRPISLRKP